MLFYCKDKIKLIFSVKQAFKMVNIAFMKVNFKYIQNFDADGKTAEMFIYDEIDEEKVNGTHFAHELRYLIEVEGVERVKVRINSPGGSVMQAFSIFSAILNANANGKAVVDTYNDGVAASSAGFILMAGRNVYAKDYSRIMLHGVSTKDNKNLTEKDRAALDNFSDMIKNVFVSRTGIVASVIEDLLNNGLDNWFNVKEAVNIGFLKTENIENTGVKIDLPDDLKRTALAVANKAQKILETQNKKPLLMKKVIAKLGLQEAANEDAVLAAVSNALKEAENAKSALTKAENKVTKLEGEKDALQTKLDAVNKSAALTVVENAIKEGKFTPKDENAKKELLEKAEADLPGFKNMISMMPTKAANVLDVIEGEGDEEDALKKVNNRGLRQLEKEDPALLSEIRNNHKTEFVKMYNKAYGTEKTEAELY